MKSGSGTLTQSAFNKTKKENTIELIECKEHKIKCKYFCVSPNCTVQTKIACSECMFEGNHIGHEYRQFTQIMSKLNEIKTKQFDSDKMKLEMHINESFKSVEENLLQELQKYKQYFLEQILPLNLAKISRLTYQKLIGNSVTQEDIQLINNIDNELSCNHVQLFMKNQLNEYIDRLKEDVEELITVSLQPFALKKEQILDFKDFQGKKYFTIRNAHENHINDVEILSKNTIVTASSDKNLNIYDLIDKRQLLQLKSDSGVIKVIKCDDKILISGHKDGTINFWNWPRGKKIAGFSAHEDEITGLVMIDAKTLASSSWDCMIKIWDIEKGKCLKQLKGHTDAINALDLLDEFHLISGGNDYIIKIWEIESDSKPTSLKGHIGKITALAVLNNEQIVSGDEKATIIVWRYKTEEIMFKIQEHTDMIMGLLRINKAVFASCGQDGKILIFDSTDGVILHELQDGHSGFITNLKLTYESHLVSVGMDKRVVVWN